MGLSPMMAQYQKLKEQYKDTLLFFRLGDFYELFFDDAITASRELEITLTQRSCGDKNYAPMCGVPFHSAESYISRLIAAGFKVAICEQMSEPQKGRTLVDRDIVRIVTPGTIIEDSILDREKNNYLLCVYSCGDIITAAWSDISTGELGYSACDSLLSVNELLGRLEPSEILCNSEMQLKSVNLSTVKFGSVCPFSIFDDTAFEMESARQTVLSQLGTEFLNSLKGKEECIPAIGAILSYITRTQKRELTHLNPTYSDSSKCMSMDFSTRRNLELFKNISDGGKRGSLLWAIDKTKTSFGARTLRSWLESPLLDADKINERLDGVGELAAGTDFTLQKLSLILSDIKDIERICGRLSCKDISPKDCYALGSSLKKIPEVKQLLAGLKSDIFVVLNKMMSGHEQLSSLIVSAIKCDAPAHTRDGGLINAGFDSKLDEYINYKQNVQELVKKIELAEREETGIKNLRISYNRIIGYFIEVTKSNLNLVPYRYQRRGSTLNSERFITEELKSLEDKVLGADENALKRENELYCMILERIKQELELIIGTAKAVAGLDCLMSFATVTNENGYVRPIINNEGSRIKIAEGRHPVVEKMLRDSFVPNDTLLDESENKIMVITGPNMAGKSIYMRQVALLTIMAQIGCFVPALSAELCITDRIFTRIGASDDVKTGRSTFMVEMSEVSNIMRSAGDKSLILLDEVGRGTSTYDGLSIAWAILEQLSHKYKSKVLFSTHYHELTELEGQLSGIKNYKLTVREVGDTIVFVRKLLRGSANRSFGIEVAALAGLPNEVIERSKQLLAKLSSEGVSKQSRINEQIGQVSIFDSRPQNEVYTILSELDLDSVTPRHALDILGDLKEKIITQK